MKLIHLSDLHLGKRVHEQSMLEDQAYILREILAIVEEERPDGVLIAGDVYDRPIPPVEAVTLFDGFLVALSQKDIPVFLIGGNHDSTERMSFGGRLMERSGVYVSPAYNGRVESVTLRDDHGEVDVWLLPFVKPAHVRATLPEDATDEVITYTDALRVAISRMERDASRRHVLVTHQFVAGCQTSDSEERSVGGTDCVDAMVFDGFDYVALGHLHRPQQAGEAHIRYCGTPLKYSFSEVRDEKSVTIVELFEKGNICVRTLPLTPLRDMKEIRGTYDEVTLRRFYEGTTYQADYLKIVLTDEEDVPDGIGKLRVIYPNLLRLEYDNTRTRTHRVVEDVDDMALASPVELFSKLYETQNNQPMTDEQGAYMAALMERLWGR